LGGKIHFCRKCCSLFGGVFVQALLSFFLLKEL